MEARENCSDLHRFYVTEMVAVEAEGKIHIFLVCTGCGCAKHHEFQVSLKGSPLRLLPEKEKEEN